MAVAVRPADSSCLRVSRPCSRGVAGASDQLLAQETRKPRRDAPGLFHLAVESAAVYNRSVSRIKPRDVRRNNGAEGATIDQSSHFEKCQYVGISVTDSNLSVASACDLEHFTRFFDVKYHRFLDGNVIPGFESEHDVRIMALEWRQDMNHVRLRLLEQVVKLTEGLQHAMSLGECACSIEVAVADRDKFEQRKVLDGAQMP